MVVVSGFGGVDSTIAETVGMGKVYRGQLEDRLREKPRRLPEARKTLLVNGGFL